ncbi:MAG: N-acetylmuramoyl-L-alanine amidase [Hespellia sp.]|nr:N-acetylmuramoyl-L-alanine amidase [Hespellia sp.]
MSICGGVAGVRGGNPNKIFFHNDGGSQNANAAFYQNWLQSHPLENGFAHYYVADDGILQAEDDWNMAWHCGDSDGNANGLSVEACQSLGDTTTFLQNEEKALQLAARKCMEYGIVPSASTIMLHQEVYATSCPHRSVEIHGGFSGCKNYFINRIRELMGMEQMPEVSYSGGASAGSGGDAGVVFTYGVRTEDGTILPFVNNLADFAGIIGQKITDIAIKVNKGSVRYRVHILGRPADEWLDYVTGCDWNDPINGFAGNGQIIDAIEVYYYTPADIVAAHGYQQAQYRVSPVNGNYYPWQYDNDMDNGQDGFAGAFGIAMDRFQLF